MLASPFLRVLNNADARFKPTCYRARMIYVPPDYDDELTPEMREQRDRFRALLDMVLTKFRGETRRLLIVALLDTVEGAVDAHELCDAACEELKMEFQFRYQDALRREQPPATS